MKLAHIAAATLLALLTAPAVAQTAPAPQPKPATSAPAAPATAKSQPLGAKPAKSERSAKSLDCSKQADAKNLHGKERKKFRQSCLKG